MNGPIFHQATACLALWGRSDGGSVWLGLPKRNTIHRLMTEGVGASVSTAPLQVVDLPQEILVIQRVLAQLDPELVDVLVARFVKRLSERNGAERLGLSRNEYRRRMNAAIWYVAGALVCEKTLASGGPMER